MPSSRFAGAIDRRNRGASLTNSQQLYATTGRRIARSGCDDVSRIRRRQFLRTAHGSTMLFNMFGWIWRRTPSPTSSCSGTHLVLLVRPRLVVRQHRLLHLHPVALGPRGSARLPRCGRVLHPAPVEALVRHRHEHSIRPTGAAAIVYALILVATVTVWTLDLTRRRRRKAAENADASVPGDRSRESAITAELRP